MKAMIIYIFLILSSIIRCGDGKPSSKYVTSNQSDEIIIQITNDIYKLDLVTNYKRDTLNVVDWDEDKYSNPIIVKQVLKFYKHSHLVKEHELPIKYITKETIKGTKLNVPEIPLISICYHKGIKEDYFMVSGSDFCMGVLCPEFTGIYELDGNPLFEASNESLDKFKMDLSNLISTTGIQINNPDKCMSLIKDKKFWDK